MARGLPARLTSLWVVNLGLARAGLEDSPADLMDSIDGRTRVSVRLSDPGGEIWTQIGAETSRIIVAKLESLLVDLSSPALL